MNSTNTIVLGAGQAGLAVSRCLTDLGIDHVVLDRGRVAERWRSERWDSLRLLTPNWMTRLPGFQYDGPDESGFMTAAEAAAFFDRYSTSFGAPVQEHTTIEHVAHTGEQFVVTTDRGLFRSTNVIIATGWCDQPAIPDAARHLSSHIHQLTPNTYRRATDVPDGGVLVVGASSTGVQLADELCSSGHDVTLAVGRHSRMPRRYRGMDIFWWLEMTGVLDKTIDDVADAFAARAEPSLQLVGRDDHSTLDLLSLQAKGVQLVGRVAGIDANRVTLGTDLSAVVEDADRQLSRVLARIDEAIARAGLVAEVLDPEPIQPVAVGTTAAESIDLVAAGINSVVWATGFRRSYGWLELPILDRRGEVQQHRGLTPFPGAYVLGQRFQHFRNSNFIDGVGRDARFVAEHICRARQSRRDLFLPNSSLN